MKNFTLLVLATVLGMTIACKSDSKEEKNETEAKVSNAEKKTAILRGHWMQKEWNEGISQLHSASKLPAHPLVIEFYFATDHADSVGIVGDDKVYQTPILSQEGDSLQIAEGLLVYNNTAEADLLLFKDKKSGSVFTYIRMESSAVLSNGVFNSSVISFVNDHTIAGDYTPLDKKGKKTEEFVVLKNDGSVLNESNYDKYEVCIKGECMRNAPRYTDIVYLSKEGKGEYFAYELIDYSADENKIKSKEKNRKGEVLTFYKVSGKEKLSKGEIAFEWSKK